jgi:gamma-glutamyl:cysteine ligase YbdK (ATP-grasp superfamily)
MHPSLEWASNEIRENKSYHQKYEAQRIWTEQKIAIGSHEEHWENTDSLTCVSSKLLSNEISEHDLNMMKNCDSFKKSFWF